MAIMAMDQYGTTYHNLGKYPRKKLCEILGNKHVEKIYADGVNGSVFHTGYYISGLWLNLYTVEPLRKREKRDGE